jgi:hypothetical protein
MKRMRFLIAIFALSAPFVVSAVTSEADSNPFTFPGVISPTVGIKVAPAVRDALSAFQCRAESRSGITTIHYTTVPASIRNAKMTIFNLAGAQVASFDLRPGTSSIQWSIEKHSVAAGVYWSSIRFGSVEKKTKISMVK